LKDKVFLEPSDACADTYYERLIAEPKMERLHNAMRRNYAAALQDDAQQAINNLMKMEPTETRLYRVERLRKYLPYPRYLHRAAELLGQKHYFYPTLRARTAYFEGNVLQMESPLNSDSVIGWQILEKYHEALTWQPNDALTYFSMAKVFIYQLRNIDSVVYYGEKTIAAAPNWIRAYTSTALGLNVLKDFQKALGYAEKGLAIDSSSALTWTAVGVCHARLNNYNDAEHYLQKAIELDTSFEPPQYWLGWIYFNRGKMQEAIRYFLGAARADHPSDYTFFWLGNCYMNASNWAEADKYFRKGLEIEPQSAGCMVSLAGVCIKTGRISEAKELIGKALAYDSVHLFMAGEMYVDNGLYDEAENLYQAYTEQHPLKAEGWDGLAYTWYKAGRYAEAERASQKAVALSPSLNYYQKALLGQVHIKIGKYDEARMTFLALLEQEPENPEIAANLAILSAIEGDTIASLNWADIAFKNGMSLEQIYEYPYFDFAPVRTLPGFEDLMKKYFPNKAKD
jgi:tetratricopeptide (TPR) repeat protein